MKQLLNSTASRGSPFLPQAGAYLWVALCGRLCNEELEGHQAVFLKQVSHFAHHSISLL